eukprot:gene15094-biopygen624
MACGWQVVARWKLRFGGQGLIDFSNRVFQRVSRGAPARSSVCMAQLWSGRIDIPSHAQHFVFRQPPGVTPTRAHARAGAIDTTAAILAPLSSWERGQIAMFCADNTILHVAIYKGKAHGVTVVQAMCSRQWCGCEGMVRGEYQTLHGSGRGRAPCGWLPQSHAGGMVLSQVKK